MKRSVYCPATLGVLSADFPILSSVRFCFTVALRAKEKGIPVIGLCGSIGDGAEKLYDFGITSLVSISDSSMSLDYAMKNAEQLYYKAAVRLFCQIQENGI